MRHSLRFKFSIILIVLTVLLVGIILFLNSTYAEKYYSTSIQNGMVNDYESVDEYVKKYENGQITQDEMNDSIESITSTSGVSLVIVRSDWSIFYSSESFSEELIKRLQMSIFNKDRFDVPEMDMPDKENTDKKQEGDGDKKSTHRVEFTGVGEDRQIIESNNDYTLQKVYDKRLKDSYYEMWGRVADGNYSIIIRHPYQSIKNAVAVTNKFIWIVAVIVTVVAIIIVNIVSGFLTKPIKEMSVLANRMAKLDFNTRYTGDDKSELGQLGQSMNEMSKALENTISQLKSANLELQRDLDNKNKLEEMRNEFLSNVSHELKTPIALIQGYAEGLKEGVSDDPESMEYYCDVIIDESAKMNSMVKKLLTLNQLEFGNEELVMERFNLTELVSAVVGANALRAEQKLATIELNADGDIYVWCDEYKIEEVVTNYVTNAINHCEAGSTIKVTVTRDDDHAKVTVYNKGNNIPEADINRIWDKFYKVDKARTREYGGNGIGLSIVKAILDSYNCDYGVKNVSDGVEFWFELDCKNK